MLDSYSLKARVYPMLILLLPILVAGVFYSIQLENSWHFVMSLGLVSVLTYFFSQLGRDLGKKREKELWNSWGGAPSIQILRFSDSTLDKHTKERYHLRLQSLCPIQTPINLSDPHPELDEKYAAWNKFLISKTRDTKVFNLLFKENVSYGFRRNLWAIKPIAILIILVLMILNYLYEVRLSGTINPLMLSQTFWGCSLSLLLLLIVWLFIINEEWVKTPAFSYALRLCESIEQLVKYE